MFVLISSFHESEINSLQFLLLQERVSDSSTKSLAHSATRAGGPPYAVPMIPLDNDDGIAYKG